MTKRLLHQAGFTLVETIVALAISSLVASGVAAVLIQFLTIPDQTITTLSLEQDLRRLTSWVRVDANKAQSFDAGVEPIYGTFYWLDFSTYPPTRRDAVYYWDDGVVYRQTEEEGLSEAAIVMAGHVASYDDVSFALTERQHPENQDTTLLYLSVDATATADANSLDGIVVTDSSAVDFRPESSNAARHRFYFLHNDPTPPAGNTTSQAVLPMDSTAPTATTLYDYDTERDSSPGLQIRIGRKSGDFDEGNATKFQVWTSPTFTDTATIDGRASLFVSIAAKEFAPNDLVILNAYLYDYHVGTGDETLVIKQGVTSVDSTTGWSQASVHFRPTVYTMLPGHQLRIELQIDGGSENDGMLAYDTTTHNSLLMVPFTPAGYDFTDVEAGGTTAGTVLEFGGLSVAVEDLPNPDGFRFTATGPSRGNAIVNACDAAYLLSSGAIADVTCGSIVASAIAGEVEVRLIGTDAFVVGQGGFSRVGAARIVLPAGAATTITEVTPSGFTMTQSALSSSSVTVDASSPSTAIVLTAPADSVVRVDLTTDGVQVRPSGTKPVQVEIDGEIFIIPPGGTLLDGVQGIKEMAIEKLDPYRGESSRIVSAINEIQESLTPSWWLGRSKLDPTFGHKVFSREKDAVMRLENALGINEGQGDGDDGDHHGDDLSLDAAAAALQVIADLVGADRKLAVDQLDLSIETPTLNPKQVKTIVRLQAQAQADVEEGDADRDADRWGQSIDHYRQAWEKATQALERQSDPGPGSGDDDDGEEDEGDGGDSPGVGIRGSIAGIIAALQPHAGQSDHLEEGVHKLNESLAAAWWTGPSTLDPDSGGNVFDKLEDAVKELDDALKKDDLTAITRLAVLEAIDGVVATARTLASDGLQLSLSLPALGGDDDEGEVEDQQDAASGDLAVGDGERDDSDWDAAIDSYSDAWEHATDALRMQGAFAGDDEDEVDDD